MQAPRCIHGSEERGIYCKICGVNPKTGKPWAKDSDEDKQFELSAKIASLTTVNKEIRETLVLMLEGTGKTTWAGYENGHGEEVGSQLDQVLKNINE